MIVITILGWLAVAAIVIVLGMFIFGAIEDWYSAWKMKMRYKGVEDLVLRMKGSTYWLNGDERYPFQEFYDHIVDNISRTGGINSELLRSKVDEILKKQKVENN